MVGIVGVMRGRLMSCGCKGVWTGIWVRPPEGDRWYSFVLVQCLPANCGLGTSKSVLVQIQASLSVPFAMGYSDRAATREHPRGLGIRGESEAGAKLCGVHAQQTQTGGHKESAGLRNLIILAQQH